MPREARGWWNMPCWNGLSEDQQQELIHIGRLSIDYQPEGPCERGAEVDIETMWDQAPGPRFYCLTCAIEALEDIADKHVRERTHEDTRN